MNKRLFLLACWGLAAAPVISVAIWLMALPMAFELPKPVGPVLLRAARMAFEAPDLVFVTYGSLAAGLLASGALVSLVYLFQSPLRPDKNHIRGVRFIDQEDYKRLTDETEVRNKLLAVRHPRAYGPLHEHDRQITIAGVPVPRRCEPLHFMIAGTTGGGKTVALMEVLDGALARGDRAIIADPNGEYFAKYGKRGDIIMNPFDERAPGWSIFNEMHRPYDVERYAASVIPDAEDKNSQEWHHYARTLFQQVALKMLERGQVSNAELVHMLTVEKVDALEKLLRDTPVAGLFDKGSARALSNTRFILTHFIQPHVHLREGAFSLSEWLQNGKGNLFIPWREDMASAMRPLVSTWFDVLISSMLSLPPSFERRVWFATDELTSLERLASLESGLTKGRKHGARFVCGLQSTAQLVDKYGRNNATAIRSCFRNYLYLNIPGTDPDTAEEFSKGIGDREYIKVDISQSSGRRGRGTNRVPRKVTERAVLASELHSLPDLTGYLQFAGDYPVSRVTLERVDRPDRNVAIVEA